MLVVVAVIALLLAILLPALTAARQAGEATVCGTQMQQLAQASLAYAQDNDDFMPFFASTRRRAPGSEWWVTQVARSMDQFEPGIYRCPGDPMPYSVPVYVHGGVAYMNDELKYSWDRGSSMNQAPNERPKRAEHAEGWTIMLRVTYRGPCDQTVSVWHAPHVAGDPSAIGAGRGSWQWYPRRTTDFANPAKVFLMTEGHNSQQFGMTKNNQWECLKAYHGLTAIKAGGTRYDSWWRHFGTSNLSFVDGHVERLPPIELAHTMANWQEHTLPYAREMRYKAEDRKEMVNGEGRS